MRRRPSCNRLTAILEYSSAHNTIRGNMNAIGRCLAIVRDEKEVHPEPGIQSPV